MKVRYSYLKQQFENCDDLWAELKAFVPTGDFTLGKPLTEFENKFANLIGTKHAIGVNSGTDAIKLFVCQNHTQDMWEDMARVTKIRNNAI